MNFRAAIIGHTGHGNYGHGLDVAFMGFPNIEIVAIADPDETGRKRVQTLTHAPAAYADYREMLQRERPNLVAIAPRFLADRQAMVEAAAAVGAHLYVEKPLAASLVEADAMLAACDRSHVKMAVAHQGRLHPVTLHALELVQQGEIGRLRLIRGFGKMDRRGGGQDLMILGTHVLDLMRLFGGDATWASAEILDDGRLTTPADLRAGDEEIAPIAGNGLRATYGFSGIGDNGSLIGQFESYAGLGEGEELFGFELVGEKGQLSLRGGFTKRLLRYPRPYINPGADYDHWSWVQTPNVEAGDVPYRETDEQVDSATLVQRANRRIVSDLLEAIEQDREPLGSGQRARAALELIQAIAAAHAAGGRVTLPLQQRTHPFVLADTSRSQPAR